MEKMKVLFVCIHNSARSQMAETFLNSMFGDKFQAQSAGLTPGKLNPLVVEVMKEKGFDISNNKTKSVFDFYKKGELFEYVITVCDESSAENCPIFPGKTKRLHWNFADPSKFTGDHNEQIYKTRNVRDEIQQKIENWAKQITQGGF